VNAEILKDRLLASALALDWKAVEFPDFAVPKFRGRSDNSAETLPNVFGLRLGDYPIIVAPVELRSIGEMQQSLKKLHAQMVIARSYMRSDEILNAHIMLCAVNLPANRHNADALGDWRGVVDLAQRDETVCRKIIWIPDADDLDRSYTEFLARTFLAMPWRLAGRVMDADLDRNEGLAERMLVSHGLSVAAARKWVQLAERTDLDADMLIPLLVTAQEDE
jgi:hypothetical protein